MGKVRNISFILICLINYSSFLNSILAQKPDVKNSSSQQSVDFEYKILIDNGQNLNLKEILLGTKQNLLNYESNLKPFSKQIFLCYFSQIPNLKNNDVFIIDCPNTYELKIYSLLASDSLSFNPIIENSYSQRNGFYIFELPENVTKTIINIKTSQFISFDIAKKKKETVFKSERNLNLFYGLAIGILLLLFLYHFIIYFIVRENFYLFYILQIAFSIIYLFANWGLFIPNMNLSYHKLINILVYLVFILIFLSYIKLSIDYKKTYLIYINIIPLPLILGLLDIVAPSYFSKLAFSIFSVILFGAFIHTTIKHYKKKPISFAYFLTSWIILFLGQLVYSLFNLLNITKSIFVAHSFEFGILLNNMVIALALGNKISIYKDEKNQAEISEISALQEKEKLIHEQNIILENLIKERNKVLLDKIKISENQKQEIELQNLTINNRIVEIEKINNELIEKNLEISDQNIELEKRHKILEETVEKRTKKLIKAKERAIIADKLKTSFLNNLTQEINIPMNAITGYSSIITDKDLNKENRNEYLRKIINYVDILLESVDNIVTLSRIQAGIIKPRFTEITLIELINNIQTIFKEKIKASGKNIIFQISLPEMENESSLMIDGEKMKQISNIISDTFVKEMVEGEIKINFNTRKSKGSKPKEKDKLIINIIFCESDQTQLLQLLGNLFVKDENNIKYDNPIELGLAITKGLLRILKAKSKIKIIGDNCSKLNFIFPVSLNSPNLTKINDPI